MFPMRFGDGKKGTQVGVAGRWRVGLVAVAALLLAGACSKTATTSPPVTVASTSTTSTTVEVLSNLMVDGVRPGVLQAPFYPAVTVTQVTCGNSTKGRFVRIDIPAGGPGTTAKSVLTKPTAVIVVPGAAILVDPRFVSRALYAEAMKSITTADHGSFVLTMASLAKTGGDGLTVQVGNVRVIGGYQCPSTDTAYPGT